MKTAYDDLIWIEGVTVEMHFSGSLSSHVFNISNAAICEKQITLLTKLLINRDIKIMSKKFCEIQVITYIVQITISNFMIRYTITNSSYHVEKLYMHRYLNQIILAYMATN